MSESVEQGITPALFHRFDGVADWRVTSWGPPACFRAASLLQAARLVPAIVAAGAEFLVEPDVDLRVDAVIVRVPYRGTDRIPSGAHSSLQLSRGRRPTWA